MVRQDKVVQENNIIPCYILQIYCSVRLSKITKITKISLQYVTKLVNHYSEHKAGDTRRTHVQIRIAH